MKPEITQKSPYAADVKAGETYYWCSCGLSKSQPFCDGSHKPTEFKPVQLAANTVAMVHFVMVPIKASDPHAVF